MELLLTFFLLGLLSVAVCKLFDAKAKTCVLVTLVVLVLYIVVVCFTCDLRPLLKSIGTWLEVVGHEIVKLFTGEQK